MPIQSRQNSPNSWRANQATDVGCAVKPGQRLVEEDEAGLVHHRPREGDLLQHALGEAAAAFVGVRGEPEPVEQGAGPRLRLGSGTLPEAGDELQLIAP